LASSRASYEIESRERRYPVEGPTTAPRLRVGRCKQPRIERPSQPPIAPIPPSLQLGCVGRKYLFSALQLQPGRPLRCPLKRASAALPTKPTSLRRRLPESYIDANPVGAVGLNDLGGGYDRGDIRLHAHNTVVEGWPVIRRQPNTLIGGRTTSGKEAKEVQMLLREACLNATRRSSMAVSSIRQRNNRSDEDYVAVKPSLDCLPADGSTAKATSEEERKVSTDPVTRRTPKRC
jgi:hypothetical protein